MNDLQLNGELDLVISVGDFVSAESTSQHQKLLLLAQKGNYLQNPDRGVGVETYLNDERTDLATEIRSEFEKDGMKVSTLQVNATSIEIEAPYV